MDTKNLATASVKADQEGEGLVTAVVAAWNVDSVGDRIVKGAFADTLADWAARDGENIPVVWSHQHSDPFAHIGEVIEAAETDEGLVVKQQLDLENPTAVQVYRLIKGGRIRNYSFAYDVEDSAPAENGVTELKRLKLYEVGPTLIGANQETRTMAVKAAPELKKRSLGAYVESRIHRDFTNIADSLYGDGHLTREERIALSGAIGDALESFVARIEADAADLYARDLYDDPEAEQIKSLLRLISTATDLDGTKHTQPAAPANDDDHADDDLNDDDPDTGKSGKSAGKSDEPNQTGPASAMARHLELLALQR